MDLLGLAQRHPGVVRPVDEEERRPDPVDVRDRRRLDEEVEIALQRAVLALAKRPPVLRRVAEEGDEARDRHHGDAAGPALRLEGEAREHHVAAVRAAVEHRLVGREPPVRGEAIVQRCHVAHGVEPPSAVVEVLEPLPVAGRAANVRLDDGEALGGEVLDERDPHRPPLRLRAAVDLEEDRRGRLRRGAVDDERDRLAVERREALDGRCDEPVRRDSGRALRQPVRATGRRVEEPRVPRRHRRREPVREAGAGGRHRRGCRASPDPGARPCGAARGCRGRTARGGSSRPRWRGPRGRGRPGRRGSRGPSSSSIT